MAKRYDGIGISTGFLSGNLFDGDGWETERIDVPTSASRYAEMCRQRLETEFPGAEVRVEYQLFASGALPRPLETSVSGSDDPQEIDDITMWVDEFCSRVYEDSDSWVVYRE